MKSKVSATAIFTVLFLLMYCFQSCESEDKGGNRVSLLQDWTIQAQDTLVFTHLGQTLHIPYKIVDSKGREVAQTGLHIHLSDR